MEPHDVIETIPTSIDHLQIKSVCIFYLCWSTLFVFYIFCRCSTVSAVSKLFLPALIHKLSCWLNSPARFTQIFHVWEKSSLSQPSPSLCHVKLLQTETNQPECLSVWFWPRCFIRQDGRRGSFQSIRESRPCELRFDEPEESRCVFFSSPCVGLVVWMTQAL